MGGLSPKLIIVSPLLDPELKMDELSTTHTPSTPLKHEVSAAAANSVESTPSPIDVRTAVAWGTTSAQQQQQRDFTAQSPQLEQGKRAGLAAIMTTKQQMSSGTALSARASTSPLSTASSVASSASRTPKLSAFYVDLTSPVSIKAHAPLPSLKRLATRRFASVSSSMLAAAAPPPWSDDVLAEMNAKAVQASLNRNALLQERKEKLQHRAEFVQRRVLLQRHKDRLSTLKQRIKFDYALTTATIKRQLMMQQRAEKFGALVEHAQNVAMMKRLERCLHLRRSISTTFAELVSSRVELEHLLGDDDATAENASYTPSSPTKAEPSSSLSRRHHKVNETLRTGHDIQDVTARTPSPVSSDVERSPAAESVGSSRSAASNRSRSPKSSSPLHNTMLSPTSTPSAGSSTGSSTGMRRSQSVPLDLLPHHAQFKLLLPPKHRRSKNKQQESDGSDEDDDHSESASDADDATSARSDGWPHLTIDIPSTANIDDYLPPITRYTLRELEMSEVLGSIQLRHDLIFDPDMSFRPNTDGQRGTVKHARSEQYWSDVAAEIVDAPAGKKPWLRVPLMIIEIRQILLELIPFAAEDEVVVEETLDMDLLLQQLKRGAIDFVAVMSFIARHLHEHCAPCRDETVDEMMNHFRAGDLIAGFRLCFDIMEYMKLDFANHRLKKLRPWVLENAVEYEWKYMKEQLDTDAITIEETQVWLTAAYESDPQAATKPHAQIYNEALVNYIMSPDSGNRTIETIPETLRFDLARLASYHNDWQDLTIMCALMMLFRQAAGPKCMTDDVHALKRGLWVLLNDSATTMKHVALQLVDTAGKVRGRPYTSAEATTMTSLVDKTLATESVLYDLLQKRIKQHLADFLSSGKLDSDALRKHGLAELEEELKDLGDRIKLLADHNRRTYAPIYDAIFEECVAKRTKPHAS
ncbi:Protein SOSEKI 1 [Sorochytrium milnesiophthora]